MVLFFIVLLLMIFSGFPIYLCLVGSSLLYFTLNQDLSMFILIEKMINAPNNFTLVAVPFFILAGQLMNTGGITNRIFDLADSFVGHLHGGLGYVNVIASMLFSGMSGSAAADIGGLGMVEIEAMRKAKYDDGFIIGVTGASSTIGPIIPPSVPFVIYGVLANVSVGGLFTGGIIPGIIMGLCLCIMTYIVAKRKSGMELKKRASIKEILISLRESILALLMPLIILGGIWGGFFTPTEAAFISILYAFIVTLLVFKTLDIKEIPNLLLNTVKIAVPAIVIVSAASIFGWIMIYNRVDKALINIMFTVSSNKFVILMMFNAILLFCGMFFSLVPSLMLTMPIFIPIAITVGIHPIHLGVVSVLNLMLGGLTPPVGGLLNILCSVTGIKYQKIVMMIMPWLIPLFIALLIISFFPETVLFLPRLMGFVY